MNRTHPPETEQPETKQPDNNVINLDEARQRKIGWHATHISREYSHDHLAIVEPLCNPEIEELKNTFNFQMKSLTEPEGEMPKDINGILEQANQTLYDLYETDPKTNRLPLAATFLHTLDQCHENYTRAAAGHPELLKLIGVGVNIDREETHPSLRITRMRALKALSLLPGTYDLATGKYTPSSAN